MEINAYLIFSRCCESDLIKLQQLVNEFYYTDWNNLIKSLDSKRVLILYPRLSQQINKASLIDHFNPELIPELYVVMKNNLDNDKPTLRLLIDKCHQDKILILYKLIKNKNMIDLELLFNKCPMKYVLELYNECIKASSILGIVRNKKQIDLLYYQRTNRSSILLKINLVEKRI